MDPLGPAPAAGLAEQQATWRTAHDALGLPDRGGDDEELSNEQLRIRAAAYRREEAWAPRYVADEPDAAHQAAARHRADAQVWAARADATVEETEAARHRAEADAARAQADALDQRAADLEEADQARAAWYAATAATRDAATCAEGVLTARGVHLHDPDDRTTVAEWLAAQRADQAAEDRHREITDEAQLYDPARDAGVAAATDEPMLETAVPDVRDVSTPDTAEHADPQRGRVPSTDETAAAVTRAQIALAEIAARREADALREAEHDERGETLTRWSDQDRTAEAAGEHSRGDDALARDD